MIHAVWRLRASAFNVSFYGFFTYEDFLERSFSKDIFIYVDSKLKNEVRGEDVCIDLHKRKFKNIFITSGYDLSNFLRDDLCFLKGVIGKEPPF